MFTCEDYSRLIHGVELAICEQERSDRMYADYRRERGALKPEKQELYFLLQKLKMLENMAMRITPPYQSRYQQEYMGKVPEATFFDELKFPMPVDKKKKSNKKPK
jgi:hypothetical protein